MPLERAETRPTACRQPADDARPGSHARLDGTAQCNARMREAERVEQRVVEQRVDQRPADALRKAGEPIEEHVPCRGGHFVAGARVREAVTLERDVELLELVVAPRDAADPHPASDLAPEEEGRLALELEERTPAEAGIPADRLEDHRREHVEEVVVLDREVPVDPVHAPDGAPPELGFVTVLAERRDQDLRVVVALLRPRRELAGRMEELRDRGHGVRPVERELERALRVPRELERGVDEHDPLRVALGVECLELAQPAIQGWRTGLEPATTGTTTRGSTN